MAASHKYDDIIGLPRPVSTRRSHMSNYDRAAQFSPFAALTGYDSVIQETARLTEQQIELDEDGKALLDQKLLQILYRIPEQPSVTITCYRPDERKQGGTYVTVTGQVKRIDTAHRCILFTDGRAVDMDCVFGIELQDNTSSCPAKL